MVPRKPLAQGADFNQLLHDCCIHAFTSRSKLRLAIDHTLHHFTHPSSWGLVLLLLSVLFTRGREKVLADMDTSQSSGSLIVNHAYCSQELVNLLMTGRANSHVHDGVEVHGGMVLNGIGKRGRIGFLSLNEWYGHIKVGAHMKCPFTAVWVVCSESHFSVLFGCGSSETSNLPMDLYYYDGLAGQSSPIRLTLHHGDALEHGTVPHDSMPPLDCVIRTRWPCVTVNWNDTEPIL